MAIELAPLPLPASADSSRFTDFGRQVVGLHPGKLTPEQLTEIQEALYKQDRSSSLISIKLLMDSTQSTMSFCFEML